jgi:superfamily II DNA or RNA helicase
VTSRRFTGRQRAALYLAADGRCESTGDQLVAGWHADHVVPFSRGGPTDIANGAALTPSANLRKGATVKLPLLPWQTEAHAVWEEGNPTVLVHAHTAAGKTRLAAAVIETEVAAHLDTFVIVVVPKKGLRTQWADRLHEYTGIVFDPTFENSEADPRPDVRGIIVTYQSVDRLPDRYRRICGRRRTVAIFDEVHHCGEAENLSWGQSVSHGFELAARRLMLTGTPVRVDGAPLSFLVYAGDPPTAKADYVYPYWKGLRDGIVRPIEFRLYGANARWHSAGQIVEQGLGEVSDEDEGVALVSALDPESDWVALTLPEAAATLGQIRRFIPDAAGLIIGKDQQGHVQRLAGHMGRIVGRRVPFAVSDDRDAHATIERFARSDESWIAAVNMISEGVDIPRIMVIVYATWVRTEPAFRQAVGRAIRIRRPPLDRYNRHAAVVFLPAVPTFVDLATQIEQERDMALRERDAEAERDGVEPAERREALAASSGWYQDTILSGTTFEPGETQWAAKLGEQAGVIGSPAQIARLLRAAGQTAERPSADSGPSDPAAWRKHERLKADVNRLARTRAIERAQADGRKANGEDFKAVFNDLYRRSNVWSIEQASTETLERWISWLAA